MSVFVVQRLPALATESSFAARMFGLWAGFINVERLSTQIDAIQRGNRTVCFGIVRHLDKCESARSSGVAIPHKVDPPNYTVRLKQLTDSTFRRILAEISHKDTLHVRLSVSWIEAANLEGGRTSTAA
jgi:hypothetical protein